MAYLSVTDGPPGLAGPALFGYAPLHAAVGLRLLPWPREQAFAPGYWAYTFGISALPLAAPRLMERGQTGPAASLAFPPLVAATLAIGAIAAATIRRLVQGRPIPAPR